MQSVTESWQEIAAWLQDALPAALGNLRPPAADGQIEEAERAIGLSFPAALEALYRLHDGEANNWPPGVFADGHWFMPLSEMVRHRNTMAQFAEADSGDSFAAWKSAVEDHIISISGPVKPHIYSLKWIPLTSCNGDVHRYLDFDPAPGGTSGQLIEHDPEGCVHRVLAESLEAYLARYATDLEGGRYAVEEACICDTRTVDEPDLEVPDYLADTSYEYVDEASPKPAPAHAAIEAGEELELEGEMGALMGTGNETLFSLTLAGGEEYSFLATNEDTRGFRTIAVRQHARIRAVKYNKVSSQFVDAMGSERPNFLALEYKMLKRG